MKANVKQRTRRHVMLNLIQHFVLFGLFRRASRAVDKDIKSYIHGSECTSLTFRTAKGRN